MWWALQLRCPTLYIHTQSTGRLQAQTTYLTRCLQSKQAAYKLIQSVKHDSVSIIVKVRMSCLKGRTLSEYEYQNMF